MKRIANLHASTSLPLPFSLVPSYFLCAAGFPPFRASLTACFVPVVESTAMSCAAAVSVAENSTTWPFSLSASTTAWSTRRAVPSPIAFWFSAHNTFGKSWWCIRGIGGILGMLWLELAVFLGYLGPIGAKNGSYRGKKH